MLSLDGAQLYRNKESHCWMYIWVVFSRSPNSRYKKQFILPGGVIPGPKPPQNEDSFLFPGLHHLAVLQKEGLRIWSPLQGVFNNQDASGIFTSHPFLALCTADGPAMASLSGFVGHKGKLHCRLYYPLSGRRKEDHSNYYPALLLPNNYTKEVEGSMHPDVDPKKLLSDFNPREALMRYMNKLEKLMLSRTRQEFNRNRLDSGICKPSIISGLNAQYTLAAPACFPLDIMHLASLNIPDLFLSLWCGQPLASTDRADNSGWPWAVLKGKDWEEHGKHVEDLHPWFPGSFDRVPRNIASKLMSGYKAWEFTGYFYGEGPCLLSKLLPEKYWRHYCLGVSAFRLLMQQEISQKEIKEAYSKILRWTVDFENLYYERKQTRLHFVRPSMHAPLHIAPETMRIGPTSTYSQWGMERTIGNLGEEIGQHSNPYENIAQRAIRRGQINALKSAMPEFGRYSDDGNMTAPPRNSHILGGGYLLKPAIDKHARPVTSLESQAITEYLLSVGCPEASTQNLWRVVRWACLQLPNGQKARTQWKEDAKPFGTYRTSRNVKGSNSILSAAHERFNCIYSLKRPTTIHKLAKCIFSCYIKQNQSLLYRYMAPRTKIFSSCHTGHITRGSTFGIYMLLQSMQKE